MKPERSTSSVPLPSETFQNTVANVRFLSAGLQGKYLLLRTISKPGMMGNVMVAACVSPLYICFHTGNDLNPDCFPPKTLLATDSWPPSSSLPGRLSCPDLSSNAFSLWDRLSPSRNLLSLTAALQSILSCVRSIDRADSVMWTDLRRCVFLLFSCRSRSVQVERSTVSPSCHRPTRPTSPPGGPFSHPINYRPPRQPGGRRKLEPSSTARVGSYSNGLALEPDDVPLRLDQAQPDSSSATFGRPLMTPSTSLLSTDQPCRQPSSRRRSTERRVRRTSCSFGRRPNDGMRNFSKQSPSPRKPRMSLSRWLRG